MLEKLQNQFKSISSDQHHIMSNVAIASAVTAYARIVMIPFKIDPNTLYTDTDSYFTTTPIDPSLIGDSLGLMKDEMKGIVIQEAIFLGPKKYGYWYIDEVGNKVKDTRFYKVINWSIKIVLIINLIVGTGYILYFTDYVFTFDSLSTFYSNLIKPYIDFLKTLWNDLININIEDSLINKMKDSNIDLKQEIKVGIKEGVKEALNEILDELHKNEIQSEVVNSEGNSHLLKQLALFSSVVFFGYFLFVLPGPSIDSEVLTQYNWFNQSLIEFKITVKDIILNIISNPDNPGTPDNIDLINSPISPTNLDQSLNTYFPIKPSNSGGSEGLSTITPNTPRISISEIGTQTIINSSEASTETIFH
jgi:hypothetical protein